MLEASRPKGVFCFTKFKNISNPFCSAYHWPLEGAREVAAPQPSGPRICQEPWHGSGGHIQHDNGPLLTFSSGQMLLSLSQGEEYLF